MSFNTYPYPYTSGSGSGSPPYIPLSWTTGYRALYPFSPQLHDPLHPNPHPHAPPIIPLHPSTPFPFPTHLHLHPIYPHPFASPPAPPPPPPPAQPTPYYLTQQHLSRPPSIPNPFPHPIPRASQNPLRTTILHFAPWVLPCRHAILTLYATIPVLGYYIYSEVRIYIVWFCRRAREVDWMGILVAFVVFFFLPLGPRCGEGEADGDAGGAGVGNVMEMEPVYVIAVANCRNMGGLLRAGGKGELVVV